MLVVKNDKKHLEAIIVIIAALIVIWFLTDKQNDYLVTIGGALGILHVLSAYSTLLIARLWFGLSEFMGQYVSKIVLTVSFYVCLIPIAFVQKLFKKNALQLSKKNEESYFLERNYTFKKEDFSNPW